MLIPSGMASRDDVPVIEIPHECLLLLIHLLINHTQSLTSPIILTHTSSPTYLQTHLSQSSRTPRIIEVLVRLFRPHIRRPLALNEPNTNIPALNLLHLLQRHLAVRATLKDISSQELLLVDLAVVGFEALDALKQLAAAEGAIAMADVAAELVVLLAAVFVGGFDDDETVGERGEADVAGAAWLLWGFQGGGLGRATDGAGSEHGSSGKALDCVSATAYWNRAGQGLTDVFYAETYADFGLASNEIDLAGAGDDLLDFLCRHDAVSATLQGGIDTRLVVVDLTEVRLKATNAFVHGLVSPGAVSVTHVTSELDEGAVLELDDGRAVGEEVVATVVGGPCALLFRRSGLTGRG
jgi:hypothetical protein